MPASRARLRIALDARFLTHPQEGGFKTYTTNLVRALGEVDAENEYILYVDREPDGDGSWARRPNFTIRTVPDRWPLIGMPIREQWGLRRRLAADRPDVVHFPCNTATIGIATRYVVTLHDRIQLRPQPFPIRAGSRAWRRWAMTAYARRSIRATIAGAARVIAVSRHEGDALVRDLGLDQRRVVVTHEAASPAFRRLAGPERERALGDAARCLGGRRPFLVAVGFEPRKRIPTLIDAVARLSGTDADLSLVVVASAAHSHAALRAHAEARGIGDRVVVLGRTALPAMLALYAAAEALVFPSAEEGFGLPPLEAMACGTPVIARRATSVPEIVGDAAILVETDDPDDWARAITRLRATPRLRDELAARGLRRSASFSWRRCAEQTVAIYREVAGTARHTSGAGR